LKNFVLQPLSLNELTQIFDKTAIKVIDFYIRRSLFAQPEIMPNQLPLPIHVPKEHIEQWVVQAIGASPVGAGSYPVDVIKPGEFGADVKMLSCKTTKNGELSVSESGETSLAQKFKDTGSGLDQLFSNQQYTDIVEGWTKILKNKLETVIEKDSVNNIYYLFILRADTKFYLCGLKVNVKLLDHISVLRTTKESVFLDNFIDGIYGNVKIYKAKKRLELRLRPKQWVDDQLVIPFHIPRNVLPVKMRELILTDEFNKYKENIIINIF